MKKLAIWALAAVFAFGTIQVNARIQDPKTKQKNEQQHKATHNKATENKATRDVGKAGEDVGHAGKEAGKDVGKGAEHGAYDVTHNKATKKTDINKGNQKYSDTKKKENQY